MISAGVLSSLSSGMVTSGAMAMTGEITLHGRVLPIGGVKEKLLAAYRLGITRILLPRENAKDLEKIDSAILDRLDIRLMDQVDEALAAVLEREAQLQAG